MFKKLKKNLSSLLALFFSVGIFAFSFYFAEAQNFLDPIGSVKQGFAHAAYDLVASLAIAMMTLVAWILAASGTVLDAVIDFTVVEMSGNIDNIGTLNQAWATLRDLANMAFIWILLYIAIATILNLQSGDTKRMLVKVIIIALLINFSLFATKIVIDFSNILTIQFYDSITANPNVNSLSQAFMQPLGLSTFYNAEEAFGNLSGRSGDSAYLSQVLVFGIMGSVFLLVTAFVFLAVMMLLIIRYVILILLMILSPLALAAMVLPKTNEYFQKWFRALIDQSFFAPLFFILAWVVVMLMGGGVGGGAGNMLDALTTLDPSTGSLGAAASTMMNFIIIIVFILAALVISKTLSSRSSGQIGAAMTQAGKNVGGYVGTRTVGRGAAALDRRLEKTRFGQTTVGSALRTPLGYTGSSQFGGKFKSGEKVEKDVQKRREEYGKLEAKNTLEKGQKLGKEEEGRRKERLDKLQKGRAAPAQAEYQREVSRIRQEEQDMVSQGAATAKEAREWAREEAEKAKQQRDKKVEEENKKIEKRFETPEKRSQKTQKRVIEQRAEELGKVKGLKSLISTESGQDRKEAIKALREAAKTGRVPGKKIEDLIKDVTKEDK